MKTIILYAVIVFAVLAQNPETAVFPGRVATDNDLLVAKNKAQTTLSTNITVDELNVLVASGAAFPASNTLVFIDDEAMKICSVAGNILSVCVGGRGFDHTTAASHTAGARVSGYIASRHVNQLSAEMKAVQTMLGAGFVVDTAGTANSVAKRDSSGQLTAPQFNGSLHGNAETASVLFGSPVGCTGQVATGISSSGNASCVTLDASYFAAGDYSSKITSGTYNIDIGGNAATVSNGVYTSILYTDPPWLTITNAKVGLSLVENVALSTWVGSSYITTLGTITSGTIPAARISGAVATATALAANGTNCVAGSVGAGVDTFGNEEGCLAVELLSHKDVASGYLGLDANTRSHVVAPVDSDNPTTKSYVDTAVAAAGSSHARTLFNCTTPGAVQNWTVPSGITSLSFIAIGGGGNGYYLSTTYHTGVSGAATFGTYPVAPGDVIPIVVGCGAPALMTAANGTSANTDTRLNGFVVAAGAKGATVSPALTGLNPPWQSCAGGPEHTDPTYNSGVMVGSDAGCYGVMNAIGFSKLPGHGSGPNSAAKGGTYGGGAATTYTVSGAGGDGVMALYY
jgi:hypothetical protein